MVVRARHLADRRLLLCLLLTSLLLASCGTGLVTVYILYRGEVGRYYQDTGESCTLDTLDLVKPLVVVGAVLLGSAAVLTCCLLEVAVRCKRRVTCYEEFEALQYCFRTQII